MCSNNQFAEWDEYGASGSSSEYTIRQVISKEALAGQVPMNGSQPDLIFHRAFDAVGPGKMWLSQDAYLPLFGAPDSLTTEVRISQWAQAEGLRCQLLSILSVSFEIVASISPHECLLQMPTRRTAGTCHTDRCVLSGR
jgi:hypothetical protein